MNIGHANRVELFRQSSNTVKDGETIRCSGLDDKRQCSSPDSQKYTACEGCRAVAILATHFDDLEVIAPGQIQIIKKGVSVKDSYHYYQRFLHRNETAFILKGTKKYQKKATEPLLLFSSDMTELGNRLKGKAKSEGYSNTKVGDLVNSVIDNAVNIIKLRSEIENNPREK